MDNDEVYNLFQLLVENEAFGEQGQAEVIIEAGYRKADDVRKETAKEIYKQADKWLDKIAPDTRDETILICLLGWIKAKFGIEVDE